MSKLVAASGYVMIFNDCAPVLPQTGDIFDCHSLSLSFWSGALRAEVYGKAQIPQYHDNMALHFSCGSGHEPVQGILKCPHLGLIHHGLGIYVPSSLGC